LKNSPPGEVVVGAHTVRTLGEGRGDGGAGALLATALFFRLGLLSV